MIHYDDPALQLIENEIVNIYDADVTGYPENACLLEIRRNILNAQALAHQEELLPDIIAFNDALREALYKMYHKAHLLYNYISAALPNAELIAKCYLAYDYPYLHPYQADDRQDLFNALCDFGWNHLYSDGVSNALVIPSNVEESFETFIGMYCPPPNWNEGLDQELTKDLHLIRQFHHLFDHTNFALTDFIFVREFNIEININFEESVK